MWRTSQLSVPTIGLTCSDHLHPGSRTNLPTLTLPRCTMSALPFPTNSLVSSGESRLLPCTVPGRSSIPNRLPLRAFLDLDYLVSDQTMRLAVDSLSRLLVRSLRQAEDLA